MRVRGCMGLIVFCGLIAAPAAARWRGASDSTRPVDTGAVRQEVTQTIDITNLPLVVDGSKQPERIPDSIAFQHFLLAASVSHDASPEEYSRRAAYLDLVKLTPADRDQFLTVVRDARASLDAIEAERLQWRVELPGAIDALNELRSERERVTDEARKQMQSKLSAAGMDKIGTHLHRVKTTIKIYGAEPAV